MIIIKECTIDEYRMLAKMNKELIEDEKSNNPMTLEELEGRMKTFLETEYKGYLFKNEEEVVGYALLNVSKQPKYLRQFFICREYRRRHYGRQTFDKLVEYIGTEQLELEVLPWNVAGQKLWENCGCAEISRDMRRG